jgi:hypothetical protein
MTNRNRREKPRRTEEKKKGMPSARRNKDDIEQGFFLA